MRHFHEVRWTIEGVANWLIFQSMKRISDGTARSLPILQDFTALHYPTGTQAILTRDTGYHTSGWWKNPDYERCIHLSLCFRDIETGEPKEKDKKLTAQWIDAIFGDNNRLLWCEPPYSEIGKKRDVWHYRLFCADEGFRHPILPRGEVYSKEFTESGWLSYSDVQAKQKTEDNAKTH